MLDKAFTVILSQAAHGRLRSLSKHFKLGQNYIVIALISIADERDEALIDAVERARRLRPQNKTAEEALTAAIKKMSAREKREQRKRLGL